MKKFLAMAAALIMAVSMTACGGSGAQEAAATTVATVENMYYTSPQGESGMYTGDVVDGVPNGTGSFSVDGTGSRSDFSFTYVGKWVNCVITNGTVYSTNKDKQLSNISIAEGKFNEDDVAKWEESVDKAADSEFWSGLKDKAKGVYDFIFK